MKRCLSVDARRALLVASFAGACLLAANRPPARAAEPAKGDSTPKTFLGAAAKEIIVSLKEGNGWSVVSSRGKLELVPGAGAQDCLKYRVVKKYQTRKTEDGELVVDVEYYPETGWIAGQWQLPKNSGPSLAAAKAANTAVELLDATIAATETVEAEGELAKLKPLLLAALKSQRAALVELIQHDVAQIGEIMK